MIRVETVVFPEKYKTKNVFQWKYYIEQQLQKIRGLKIKQ